MIRLLLAVGIATVVSLIGTKLLILWLTRRRIGQPIHEDVPEGHMVKAGTPTMGGVAIVVGALAGYLVSNLYDGVFTWTGIAAMVAIIGAGVVGLFDDWLKVARERNLGLNKRAKMIGLLLVALVFVWLMLSRTNVHTTISFAIWNDLGWQLGELGWAVWAILLISATSNAVNLTDGLDGLAIGPVMINAGTYAILAYLGGAVLFKVSVAEYLFIPYLDSSSELAIYCASVIGVGFGFLWFNTYPATVFMGDVGSLALGGGIGALAVVTKNELTSLLLGGVFVVEALSVIIQVGVFKATKGKKRVFLMAPIHHHFEKKGWPEPKVIVRFWIVSIMLAVATLGTLKLR